MKRERFRSFAPVVGRAPRVLILGTLPSVRSRAAHQYYGNPQNHFWKIVAPLTRVSHECAYEARVRGLVRARIALWDVLAAGDRVGSGDATIVRERPNDVNALLARHASLRVLFFNGAAAEKFFNCHLRAGLPASVQTARLVSSSPRVRMAWPKKARAWRAQLSRALR